MVNRVFGIITLIFLGFIFMGILLHASGFSSVAGTLFSGTASLGSVLEGNQPTRVG